jgi:hypothetical protein
MARRRKKGGMFSRESNHAYFLPLLDRLAKELDPETQKQLLEPGRLAKLFQQAIEAAAPGAVKDILQALKRGAPAMRRDRAALFNGFEKRLYRSWRRPLDLTEMLLVIAAESGELFSDQWPWSESEDQDLVFDVLRRLHARGCQVAHEIFTLLKSGYASGAHARWRALHETAVTSAFIAKHGKETAERYLLHEHVEAYKAALGYQKHRKALGVRPYRKTELDQMKANRDQLVARYGKAFNGNYGWAAAALQRSDEGVGFVDIEATVQLDHWRPYYKMASHPVHANPKAIAFNLGLRHRQRLLLTGPSDLGLTDPGHSTAISLTQLTITLLAMHPGVDVILAGRVMLRLTDEIGDAFLKAQRALEARGTASRKRKTARRPQPKATTATSDTLEGAASTVR